jgi:hypothetical protein
MEFLVDPLAVDFGLMITTPPLVARYERLGWIKSAEYLWAEQPQGRKRLEFPVMVLSVKEDRWPQGEVDLCGLPW